jgi:hypothetical protein
MNINYLYRTILSDEDIFFHYKELYNLFCKWVSDINSSFTPENLYELYVKGFIKHDNSIIFYNFIKFFKYKELNIYEP